MDYTYVLTHTTTQTTTTRSNVCPEVYTYMHMHDNYSWQETCYETQYIFTSQNLIGHAATC